VPEETHLLESQLGEAGTKPIEDLVGINLSGEAGE
jgi:hypothetical protein